jgi:hypothetical protein
MASPKLRQDHFERELAIISEPAASDRKLTDYTKSLFNEIRSIDLAEPPYYLIEKWLAEEVRF